MLQRNLLDTPRWDEITPLEIDAVVTQCGPQWLPKWTWRFIKQYTFRKACRRHDWDYWCGGSSKRRKIVDMEFLVRMLESGPHHKEARKYYSLVRRWGWLSFHHGKKRTYLDLANAVAEYLKD